MKPDIPNLHWLAPVSYLDLLLLEQQARVILTDSGGVQKEAYWFEVPCVTLRDETEWRETVETGWNVIVGAEYDKIIRHVHELAAPAKHPQISGDGTAASQCVAMLERPPISTFPG